MLALQRKHPAHCYARQAHVLTNNWLGTPHCVTHRALREQECQPF